MKLRPRIEPYWNLMSYGRHVGYHKRPSGTYWVARFRTITGNYRQRRLGVADDRKPANGKRVLSHEEALNAARSWFQAPSVSKFASADDRPVGMNESLTVCPIGTVYCVSHALHDYIEWKRLAAAKSYFQTTIVLINFHIIPRIASVPVTDFNGEVLRKFVRDVLETPPKRGNQALGPKRSIESIDEESLRKRKKTVNALIGFLRVAFEMAWQDGKVESERPWRILKQLPAANRPRALHLSRSECRSLLEECRPDVARLVLGALYTGCRATELLRMRCSQVGRDGYGVYVSPVKKYRPRFVFLPDEGMAWFLNLVRDRKPGEYVFLRENGRPWFGNHRHLFKASCRAAGLPEEFTFHGLRHTYASQLIQAGAPIPVVAEQLGHIDPTTVLRTYGHLAPQIRESEVRQRFTTVSKKNLRIAISQKAKLRKWRNGLHGADWRTYAKIDDLRSRRNTE